MKTDFVEIFQTVRAEMQPYAVQGLNAEVNSETSYQLSTAKALATSDDKKEEIFFSGVEIKKDHVLVKFADIKNDQDTLIFQSELVKLLQDKSSLKVTELDDLLVEKISVALATTFTYFKQNEWV
ncbi:MAG: hypothetical protein EOO47_09460 [Flavobacterium sp.]|nr:MAG: hypothetical protein EOO47_09460 [Flavobacterium sp.]